MKGTRYNRTSIWIAVENQDMAKQREAAPRSFRDDFEKEQATVATATSLRFTLHSFPTLRFNAPSLALSTYSAKRYRPLPLWHPSTTRVNNEWSW